MRKFKKFICFITGITLVRYIKRRIELKKELELISTFPKVKSFLFKKKNLIVKTMPIKMDGHLLGDFEIIIKTKNIYDVLNIQNLTGKRRIRDSIYHHPHIWSSWILNTEPTFCLGNISVEVKWLIQEKEYSAVVLLLIQFLEEGYGWEEWEKEECLSHWPEI